MFERATLTHPFPLQLRLDSAQRILAPQGEAILGWFGEASAGVAQPLTVPDRLLAPSPTSRIVYACNLPAGTEAQAALLDVSGHIACEIDGDLEETFLAASLPGGHTAIVTSDREVAALHFRWMCLTSHLAIGAVWRCFVRIGVSGAWHAVDHDYIFDAGGAVLNPPGPLAIPGVSECAGPMTLEHPDGMVTSFPCSLARVKVTKLAPDGWPKRRVLGIVMQDDNRIAAFFSDGRQEIVATAAPSSRRAARSAA